MQNDFRQLLEWLQQQVRQANFAEISILLKVHDGQLTLVEKMVNEKSKISY